VKAKGRERGERKGGKGKEGGVRLPLSKFLDPPLIISPLSGDNHSSLTV